MTSLSTGGGGGSIGAGLRDIDRRGGGRRMKRGNERERRPAATCHGWLCHDMLTDQSGQVRSVRFIHFRAT
jgi:hypothetical protein